jgi:hypothetical protein
MVALSTRRAGHGRRAITAGIGFVAGWSIIAGLLALVLRPFRRRRYA